MDQTQVLVQAIVNGLQEKKGKNIVVVDLSSIEGAICQYMVIGEGNSPSQVSTEKRRCRSTANNVRNGSVWIMEP